MEPVHLSWNVLFRGTAGRFDRQWVTVEGWMQPFDGQAEASDGLDYFLIVSEPGCCGACATADPFGCLEAFSARPLPRLPRLWRFTGRLVCLNDDPLGYAYQLKDVTAEPVPETVRGSIGVGNPSTLGFSLSRRRFLGAAGSALALAGCDGTASSLPPAVRSGTGGGDGDLTRARALLARTVSMDMHSHAGAILHLDGALRPLAGPMRDGLMSTVALAMVADKGTTRVMPDHRIEAFRDPEPGELYQRSTISFGKIHELVARDRLEVVRRAADLSPASAGRPAVVVAAEGADFLDTDVDRVDEAYEAHDLRHLQLTHYRVNALGDIQTAPPVHGGLTEFGAAVIRRCNSLGIVVDVAHGPYDLVKRAAEVSSKPLVLSHTSLVARPGPRSRQITADHARLIAATGGVIGIWPVSTIYPDISAYAQGIARMADVVGPAHVGLGSDQLGLTVPSVFADYRQFPEIAQALLVAGFSEEEAAGILGGNYARVFRQVVGG